MDKGVRKVRARKFRAQNWIGSSRSFTARHPNNLRETVQLSLVQGEREFNFIIYYNKL